ncbi:serine protease [Asanoa ishikariensis]|uniref:Streptogrisin D n=1 Tax=Asanoa ishikariensis TaxID=137265 RepID=A0A1H3UIX5_9ACTN|nr:S1 family peptidase [Asanoa ishikariensis]GIF63550.1 serine protease [Asanoa ishikariensis]SDZ61639.1 streptogrisin D [Asanoa ishikariensis]
MSAPDPTTVPKRRLRAAAALGLLGGLLVVPQAAPAAPSIMADPRVAGSLSVARAQALATILGAERTGGVYIDDSGKMVVAVTDSAGVQQVEAAGGVARLVTHSTAELASIHTALDKLAGIPGTSWGVDPSTNRVSIELDSTVSAANTMKLKAAASRYGSAVRIDRVSGVIKKDEIYTAGGDSIRNVHSSLYCSIGFNVQTPGGNKHFLTAGHCATGTQQWYDTASGEYLGHRVAVSWPGNDYADIDYTESDVTAYGTVNDNTRQITASSWPIDGESVSRAGATSNDLVGQVLLTSTTVTYSSGETLYGMIKTSLCGKGGDSGGPVYNGTIAIGIHSGSNTGDSPCNSSVSDKRGYHQPVQEVLNARGLQVY